MLLCACMYIFISEVHACILCVNFSVLSQHHFSHLYDSIWTCLLHVLINGDTLCIWPLCARLCVDAIWMCTCVCTLRVTCLYTAATVTLHDCGWQQGSETLNWCIMLVHPVTYTLLLSPTHINTSHTEHGVTCTEEGGLYHRNILKTWHQFYFKWLLSLSVFISPSSVLSIPVIKLYEKNTHKHAHISTWIHIIFSTDTEKGAADAHANPLNIHMHTRPSSCHGVKPSACHTLLLRMFWDCCYVLFPVV